MRQTFSGRIVTIGFVGATASACGAVVRDDRNAVGRSDSSVSDVERDSVTIDGREMPAPFPDAPVPGMFPSEGASCVVPCFGHAWCDLESGWCCAGELRAGYCGCGEGRGCIPPFVCCNIPGEVIRQCTPIDDCSRF